MCAGRSTDPRDLAGGQRERLRELGLNQLLRERVRRARRALARSDPAPQSDTDHQGGAPDPAACGPSYTCRNDSHPQLPLSSV